MSLGDVGSIVFELDDSVAVVTRIADKVLIAAVGPSKSNPGEENDTQATDNTDNTLTAENGTQPADLANGIGSGTIFTGRITGRSTDSNCTGTDLTKSTDAKRPSRCST